MPIELIPITEEEAQAPAPVKLVPVDPLEDFAVYSALEEEKEQRGYDPNDPGVAGKVWAGVKGVLSSVAGAGKGLWTLAKAGVPGNAAASIEASALVSQASGKLLGQFNVLGNGASTATEKAIYKAKALVDPETEADMKQLSRRASWDFQREVRDTEQFTDEWNKHVETIYPAALRRLSAIPVDNEAAGGLAMVMDPTNYVPAGAAAKWTTQVPLRGSIRAAQASLKEASLAVAKASAKRESALLMLKPGLPETQRLSLRVAVREAEDALRTAAKAKAQAQEALVATTAKQRAVLDGLATEAASSPLIARAASAGARGLGTAADLTGQGLQKVAALPEALAQRVASGADSEAVKSIADGARSVAGLGGVVPATAGVVGLGLQRAGAGMKVFGQLLAEAEGQLPFFKRLARDTKGLTSWGASLVDQSGLGQVIVPMARMGAEATRGAPFAAAAGYASSGGEPSGALQGVGGGMVFGMAGAGYGQWQRYATGALFRQRQVADVARYRQTLGSDQARTFYDAMPPADRTALATMQLAHPDLQIKYEQLGKGRPSFYYAAEDGPVAVINLDTKDGVNAVVAHEIGHHVEKHGLGAVVDRVLFGDPLLKQPGMFTQLDAKGMPVPGENGRYAMNKEWARLKAAYNERLQAHVDRLGEAMPARDDAALGREVFAEHVADYLLGRDGALAKDLRSNIWSRAIASLGDSALVGSTPTYRKILGKLGVPLRIEDRRVAGSDLFPGGLPASRDLRKLIGNYTQRSARNRQPALDDERGGTRYTAEEVTKHPEVLDRLFDGTDDVARDGRGRVLRNKDGSPRFLTPKEQQAQRAALAQALTEQIERIKTQPGADTPPAVYQKRIDERSGKVEEGWLTPWIPEAALNELAQSGKYNPVQIEHLRTVSRHIREGQGKSALFFYQPATKGGGRYASLAGDWRTETPYAIFVSKAGNVLFRTASREKLMANAQELVGKGRAGLWGNELPPLVRDIDTYLANHAAGKPGSDGIGVEKRDQINALFGIDTKRAQSANPLLETNPRAPIVIRSRRIDRTNRLTPVEEYFPTNYDKINANLRPEKPEPTPLRDTKVPMPQAVGQTLGIDAERVWADYAALQAKHPKDFADAQSVRDHVEFVVTRPEYVLPGNKPDHRVLVRRDAQNRMVALEVELRGGKYRVRSAHIWSDEQLRSHLAEKE